MVGPLVDRNKKRPLGTIQIYSYFQNDSEDEGNKTKADLGFNNDDEALFCQLLKVVSCALASLQNQQVRILLKNQVNKYLLHYSETFNILI